MKLRCYCCGEELSKNFALISMSNNYTDRVFTMKIEHIDRIDDAEIIIVTQNNNER